MESTYDIVCILGVYTFLGLGVCLALELIDFRQYSASDQKQLTQEFSYPENTNLMFDSSQNAVLHGKKEILRIKNGSTNHRFIAYLFQHKGEDIPIDKLYEAINLPEHTYINKLIANTKLPKEIRDRAFIVGKNTIRFETSFI